MEQYWKTGTAALTSFKAQKNEILQIKFDSKYFYSCTRKGFKGWTLKSLVSGVNVRTNQSPCCFSVSMNQIYVGFEDGIIRAFIFSSKESKKKFEKHRGSVTCLEIFDNKFLFSGGEDQSVKLWGMETGNCERNYKGHKSAITCIYLQTSLETVVSGAEDGIILCWELKTGKTSTSFETGPNDPVKKVCLYRIQNNWVLAAAYPNKLVVWNFNDKNFIKQLDVNPTATSVYLDETKCLTGHEDGRILLWDLQDLNGEQPIRVFKEHQTNILSITADYDKFLSASFDGIIKIWNMSDPNLPLSKKHLERGKKKETNTRRSKKYVTANESSPLIDEPKTEQTRSKCCTII